MIKDVFFTKILDKITGNAPNWKKVGKYSKEELEYILNTFNGNTIQSKNSLEKLEKSKYYQRAKYREKNNADLIFIRISLLERCVKKVISMMV